MKKFNPIALVASAFALVAMVAFMAFAAVDTQEVGAQATTAAATTAAATTAAATTVAATTAVATTAAPVPTTARPATTGAGTTAAATVGRFTRLPFYTPNKAVTFTPAFNTNVENGIRAGGGATVANAKYDGFVTSGSQADVAAFYDRAMQGLGFTRDAVKAPVSIPQQQLGIPANVYIYNKGADAYAVAFLGPISADLLRTLAPAVVSGSPAAGDSLVVLVSDIKLPTGGGTAPVTTLPTAGIGGGTADSGLNPLWLVLPLALVVVMSSVALVARRRKGN